MADSRSPDAFSKSGEPLKRLYDELVRPAQAYLRNKRALIVVPDGALHMVPFAGLVDRESGRYLVEDFPVAISPSLTLFLKLGHPGQLGKVSTALVVGNPRISETGLSLPELSGAEQEARQVARSTLNRNCSSVPMPLKKSFWHNSVGMMWSTLPDTP